MDKTRAAEQSVQPLSSYRRFGSRCRSPRCLVAGLGQRDRCLRTVDIEGELSVDGVGVAQQHLVVAAVRNVDLVLNPVADGIEVAELEYTRNVGRGLYVRGCLPCVGVGRSREAVVAVVLGGNGFAYGIVHGLVEGREVDIYLAQIRKFGIRGVDVEQRDCAPCVAAALLEPRVAGECSVVHGG